MPTQQASPAQQNIYGLLGIKTGKDEWNDLYFIIASLEEQNILFVNYPEGFVTASGKKIPASVSLRLSGWQKYEELKRSVKGSRKAFVAMEFVDPKKATTNYFFQKTLLDKYLVPAVKQTGCDLANALASEPTSGNIHARLEVEIRAARFVIAELSHHNNGAYWEAGFARALGKPVIYMHNEQIGGPRPHFDVESNYIIFGEEEKPEKSVQELKSVIRATLYGDAVIDD